MAKKIVFMYFFSKDIKGIKGRCMANRERIGR